MPSHLNSFKFLACCLSADYSDDDINNLRKTLAQDNIAWEDIITLANNMMLTPALWVSFSNKGLIEDLPQDLKDYLQELHNLNIARNKKLKSQALEAIQALNAIDFKPVLLKGSGYLFLNSFGDNGARMMYDLDIMVPKSTLQQCIKVFHDLGYHSIHEENEKFVDHHHCAPLIRLGEFGTIELHHRLLHQRADSVFPTDLAWQYVESFAAENVTINVLSPTHRVLHSILHSQVVDAYHQHYIINLRSLHDLANLIKTDGDKINWAHIQKTMKDHGLTQVLLSHLYHANKLFNTTWPLPKPANLSCQYYYLRCMAGVRWERFSRFERDMNRYSREKICRRYNCKDKVFQITKYRLAYTLELLKRWGKGFIRMLQTKSANDI